MSKLYSYNPTTGVTVYSVTRRNDSYEALEEARKTLKECK